MDTYFSDDDPPDTQDARTGHGRASSAPGPVGRLLELGAHLDAHPGGLPAHATPGALAQALADIAPATERIERATLAVLGAARAQGLTWYRVGELLGLGESGARARYHRLRARYEDYAPPLAPTLEAHRVRAWELLNALEAEVSPGTAGLAAPRLGAVLLAAALIGADDRTVRAWLEEDTLSEPAHVLLGQHPVPTGAAHNELADHASDPAPLRRSLVDLMRAALPAPEPAARAGLGHAGGEQALQAAPEHGATGPGTSTVSEEASTEAALEELDMVIGDYVDPDAGPTGRALHALSEAIGAGVPELVDEAVRDVADLDTDARSRALGPAGQAAWDQVHHAWSTRGLGTDPGPEQPRGLAGLVARAGLPPRAAEPLARLRAAAAPHLDRREPAPTIDRLAALGRAIDDSDPSALADAVRRLPTGGRDLFDATTLVGVSEPLGEFLLSLDEPDPAHSGPHIEDTP